MRLLSVVELGLEIGASLLREGLPLEFLMPDVLISDCEVRGESILVLRVLGVVRLPGSILLELLVVALESLPFDLGVDLVDIEGRDG